MTSTVNVFINREDKPENIPSFETIILKYRNQLPLQKTAVNVSGVRITLDKKSDRDVVDIWVKSGTMTEAATQDFVARYLAEHNVPTVRAPRVYLAFMLGYKGYIVTEFIDGEMCSRSDDDRIAAAVKDLIQIRGPTSQPGPIGGGTIEHPFFYYRHSSIEYSSVKELERHINKILSITGRKGRVNLTEEVAQYGLRLCPSDLKYVNFMKDKGDKIVAVDFGGYSFLPPSFFNFALMDGSLARRIFLRLGESSLEEENKSNLNALLAASGALVPFGTNNLGLKKEQRPPKGPYIWRLPRLPYEVHPIVSSSIDVL